MTKADYSSNAVGILARSSLVSKRRGTAAAQDRITNTTGLGVEAEELADLPDVLQFMQLLWAVVHGLERTSKHMTRQIGVTGPQRLVLRVVGLFPGISAGDLATVLHVHPSTLTGVLQRLAAQRLLSRSDHPTDRRRAVLRLTRRGTRINATRQGTVEAAIARALRGVSDRDRIATKRVLERLAAHLDPVDTPGSTRSTAD